MPPTKKQLQSAPKRRSSSLIQKTSIDQAGALLDQLPEKPKESWSLREAIGTLQGTITTALERGYSYEEIAEVLTTHGVKISPSSLKSYLTASRKESGVTKSRGRRKSTRTTAKTASSAAPAVAPSPETTPPAPTPGKRGRAATAKAETNGSKPATRGRTKTTDQPEATKPAARGRRKKTTV